ncbi:hypothetical protein Pst134EB_026393 [Puccinia striiformis f. sp. tritici]|nr:hypothetical protein Pst134EB_026393 [Puccinia striiformis f. sp. tritici]
MQEIKPAVVGEDEPQGDQSKGTEVEEEDEDEKVEDIESQIQKELEELKGGGRRDDRGAKKQVTRRFESKKMDCECLGFISFPKAYDPVEFSTHIVRQIQEGKSGYGLRFIQRITPSHTSGIKASPEIKANEAEVSVPIPDAGPAICPRVGLRFRIEPIIRCHDKPLNRSEVIRITGDVVKRFNGDEYIVMADECSVGHQTSDLLHRVSIDDAQVVILVCVYRYVVGVSVVRDYDKDGKRFNLRVLAETQEKEAVTAE